MAPIQHHPAGGESVGLALAIAMPLVGCAVWIAKSVAPKAIDRWLVRQTVVQIQHDRIEELTSEVERLRVEVRKLIEDRTRVEIELAKINASLESVKNERDRLAAQVAKGDGT